jgi:hypothetical protein
MKLIVVLVLACGIACGALVTMFVTRSHVPSHVARLEDRDESGEAPAATRPLAYRRWPAVPGTGTSFRSNEPSPAEAPAQPTAVVNRRPEPAEVAAGLKHHLDAEKQDPQWSGEMSNKLDSEIYGAKLEHVSQVRSRCGASLCEVTMRYDGDVDRNAIAMTLVKLPSFEGGAFYQYDEQARQSTIYVLRPGQSVDELAAN